MGRKGGKANASALAKAIKTQRHTTPSANEVATTFVDARVSAATPEFTIEDIGIGSRGTGSKNASTQSGMKTVLGGESYINVERRISAATVQLGAALDDDCAVAEELSIGKVDVSRTVRSLMPRRPQWSYELTSGRLHFREAQVFQQWLADVRNRIRERGGYPPAFEQNLQVWRQLWRVLERCDVAVVVVDARHPLLHLPPVLMYHVSRTLHKPLVVVLNKLDTVQPEDAVRWAELLQLALPAVKGVVGYSREQLNEEAYKPLPIGRAALIAASHAAAQLVAQNSLAQAERADEPRIEEEEEDEKEALARQARLGRGLPQSSPDGRLMLGFVGHPNVGKSSLINSIMGDKVVSVKATPGHTKTLQTIILDDKTCLCDSPGVVFPRLEVPREAQIVGMLIPMAQVREPFSAIRWVMERATTPLDRLLGLKPVTLQQVAAFHESGTDVLHPDACQGGMGDLAPWSPMLLCALYAKQRGLVRGGRPDCMKAGMEVLGRILEGRVPYAVHPPDLQDDVVVSLRERQHAVREASSYEEISSSGEGSDYQIDEDQYESEEEAPANPDVGLLELFGQEQHGPGSGSIASRKKQARREKLLAAEEGTWPGTVQPSRPPKSASDPPEDQ